MDPLNGLTRQVVQAAGTTTRPPLPSEAPLAMPIQSFTDFPRRHGSGQSPGAQETHSHAGVQNPVSMALKRFVLFACTLLMTVFAAHEMYLVLQVAGLTLLELFVLGLFAVLFAWVAFSFVTNLVGFLSLVTGRREPLEEDRRGAVPSLPGKTALLFPVYNEEPVNVMARLQAMHESIAETGALGAFDFFILSDTTDPDTWITEERAFLEVRDRTDAHDHLFYRHRRSNKGRKAGNIAEWVQRFGGRYEYMVVLDADSLMSGQTLIRLTAAMEESPEAGVIQTLPLIVNAGTLFARLQQFANRLYGPQLGHGLAWWHGSESNYWGHNAIIRTRAFAAQAGLPVLPGRKPIGGEIMSHDFVEAALLRRAGWAVRILPELGGSYEESPPALSDYAVRDRRWCQGNLQHLGVLPARGLHPVSRFHLLMGVGAYATAPLWLLFLLVGILIALQAQFIRPEYFPADFVLFPQWPAQDPVRAMYVFAGTMGLLFVPKLMAYLAMVLRARHRRGFGGAVRGLLSVLLESLISGLMAPIMMLNQSFTVIAALLGRDVGWNVQRRDDGALPWREVARGYLWHTLFGILLAAAAYAVSWSLFLWMTPVIIGLLLAIPLAAFTADARIARRLRGMGILLVPEESQLPPVLSRAEALKPTLKQALPDLDALSRLHHDKPLAAAHVAMLEPLQRTRGSVDTDLVIGLAKLEDVESLEDARNMLSKRELKALLADNRGFERLMALASFQRER
jgi:membrane glycosyltransferase